MSRHRQNYYPTTSTQQAPRWVPVLVVVACAVAVGVLLALRG